MARVTGISRELVAGHTQHPAANLNGTDQYLRWTSPSIPLAASNTFSMIAKLRRSSIGTIQTIVSNNNSRLRLFFDNNTNALRLSFLDTAGTSIFTITNLASTEIFTSLTQDFIMLVSVDNTTAGSEVLNVYMDDTPLTVAATFAAGNVAIDLDRTRFDIAANGGSTAAEFYNGFISPIWLSTEFVDFSRTRVRDAIVESAGVLTHPGVDGRYWSPSNRQPEIYIADTLNTPGTNDGSAGDPVANGTPYS